MNVLSIGNSFSRDAQRYIHDIAKADGVALNTFNLYIGGCALSRHYQNMLSEQRAYILEMNGECTNFTVSLNEALLSQDWDVITLQQASHKSTDYSTYQPYLTKLAEYIRLCQPKGKLLIHQTWAYEEGSPRLREMMGYAERGQMFRDLEEAYFRSIQDIAADGMIPAGALFEALDKAGCTKLHRDTFHAGYGLGRYALGLIWYAVLTGRDVAGNSFADFDEEISPEQQEIVKKCVVETVAKYCAQK